MSKLSKTFLAATAAVGLIGASAALAQSQAPAQPEQGGMMQGEGMQSMMPMMGMMQQMTEMMEACAEMMQAMTPPADENTTPDRG